MKKLTLLLAAGLFLFAIDLLLVFAADRLLWASLPKSWKTA